MPASSSSVRPASLASPPTSDSSNDSPATAAASAAARASGDSSEAAITTASRTVSGTGTSSRSASSRPRRPLCNPPVTCKGGDDLLDEERRAQCSRVDRAGECGRRRLRQQRAEQRRRPLEVQRLERELVELAGAPQLVAQPAQAVLARESV